VRVVKIKTIKAYIISAVIIIAVILIAARFINGGVHYKYVSLICYGFLIGYLAAVYFGVHSCQMTYEMAAK
jgi:hypothetical protein